MLFTEVVAASAAVGATRARTAKAATLAALLRAATPAEVEPATAWLAGEARQGRIGTGWRTLSGIDAPPAAEPTLTVEAVDTTLDALAATAGTGSTKRRAELLHGLFAAATREEQRFLTTLLGGELRHGALEGVMLEAVATAAEVPAAVVRRAFMLSGRLPETARLALDGGEPALAAVTLQVGRPVRPMLASPGDSLDAALAGPGPDVTVEYKLDGARIQVHRDGDDVRVWTRTLREITAGVPELVAQVRALPARAFVLDDALSAGHEGVVVKALDAPYAAGRRGKAWQKVKPVHTLDLVVLGAEWGYGRRTGSLSNIHLGARDPDGGEPIMVGKTFKGMTDELLAWQTSTFPGLARGEQGPADSSRAVLLRPELVVEIALDGAQRSPRSPGGVALRFARVVRYRPDKTPAQADPIDAVRGLLVSPR